MNLGKYHFPGTAAQVVARFRYALFVGFYQDFVRLFPLPVISALYNSLALNNVALVCPLQLAYIPVRDHRWCAFCHEAPRILRLRNATR